MADSSIPSAVAEARLPPDVEEFAGQATAFDSTPWASLRGFLVSYYPLLMTRAPGSLVVLGGGRRASVQRPLYLPLAEATLVAVQRADDRMLAVANLPERADDAPQVEVVTMGELEALAARPYADLRARFAGHEWMTVVTGSVVALQRELGRWIGESWRVLIRSHLPARGAFGASAALEVATVQALVSLLDPPLAGRELAHVCRVVETEVLGRPGMGGAQWTAAFGRQDQLVAFHSDDVEFVPLPSSVRFWGLGLDDAPPVSPAAGASAPACAAPDGFSEDRGERFRRLLAGPLDEGPLAELGQLMEGSWNGDFVESGSSAAARLLLQQLRAAGPARGVYGVGRGGPDEGTVVVLGRSDAAAVVREVATRFAAQRGLPVHVVSGSSDGACEFGGMRL